MHNQRPARKSVAKTHTSSQEEFSQRKELEEKLLQSEQETIVQAHQLETIFETITDGLVVYDINGEIVRANSASASILQSIGQHTDIVKDSTLKSFLYEMRDEHGRVLAMEERPMKRILHGEVLTGNQVIDVRIGIPGKDEVQLSVGGAPLRNQDGEIIGAVCLFRDVTERRQMENELAKLLTVLQETNSRLEDMNMFHSDFIATLSHEFRTTLTGIQGFSELLRDEDFHVAEVKEYASDINADALRLNRMIFELLDLEQMKSGKVSLRLAQIDINAILLDTAERMLLKVSRHTLRLDTDDTLPLFIGDYDKLMQAVGNLVANAIKYSPGGGEIVLRSFRENDYAHISVEDHGIGISSEALEKIFTPYNRVDAKNTHYNRVDAKNTHYINGTSLGLATVRQIVHMHNGQIWAESIAGQGATFHFTLPLHDISASPPS